MIFFRQNRSGLAVASISAIQCYLYSFSCGVFFVSTNSFPECSRFLPFPNWLDFPKEVVNASHELPKKSVAVQFYLRCNLKFSSYYIINHMLPCTKTMENTKLYYDEQLNPLTGYHGNNIVHPNHPEVWLE